MVFVKTTDDAVEFATLLEQRLRQHDERQAFAADMRTLPPHALSMPATHRLLPPALEHASIDDVSPKLFIPIEPGVGAPAMLTPLPQRDSSTLMREVERVLIERQVEFCEEAAALSGRFDPTDLAALLPGLRPATAILNRIAPLCTVERVDQGVRWIMQLGVRHAVLERLFRADQLLPRLEQALPATDRFGDMLRSLIRAQGPIDIEALSAEDLLALAAALEATAKLDIVKPDRRALRQLIARAQFLADYQPLLKNGFFGRDAELAELKNFLAAPRAQHSAWDGLILAGTGGAGKSTLLAKFTQEALYHNLATTIVLDFDRPGIDPGDSYWMALEIARQIGYQHEGAQSAMHAARTSIRRLQAEYGDFGSSASVSESSRGIHGSILAEIATTLQAIGQPLLLVLDTFEDVAQRGLIDCTMAWLNELADQFGSTPLKVVFSGRLYETSRALLQRYGVQRVIEIDELDPDQAQQLLIGLDIDPALAARIAHSSFLPRRPLELKLMARMVQKDDTLSVTVLEQEIRGGGNAGRELFAGLVYRRVLQRVSPQAQALAVPGLVLRYINQDLIKSVLIPALALPAMSDAQINAALDALANYEWLAYRQDDTVWHHRDLRRSMLKAMIGNDQDAARAIHRRAAEYFRERRGERNQAEAIYHELMLADGVGATQKLDVREIRRAHQYIGTSIDDLPPAAAALLRHCAGAELNTEEVLQLPEHCIVEAYHATGQRYARQAEFGAALQLINAFPQVAPRFHVDKANAWERETLFATAEWPALRRAAHWGDQAGLWGLVELVFPGAIVAPETIDSGQLEEQLTRSLMEDPWPRSRRRELAPLLNQLGTALVLLNDVRRFPLNIEALLRALVDTLPAPLPFIELILDTGGKRFFDLTAANLALRLHPHSIDRLDHASITMDVIWSTQVETYLSKLRRSPRFDEYSTTVQGLLRTIDTLQTKRQMSGRQGLWLNGPVPARIEKLLCASSPTLRTPSRFALLEAFDDEQGWQALMQIFLSVIPWQLQDLQGDLFLKSVAIAPEHALAGYVELADRIGKLDEVVLQARRLRPDAGKLEEVAKAHQRWRRALGRLLR